MSLASSTSASQATVHAASAEDNAAALGPAPGATATLIGDLRELFKFKVTAMVLVTTWAGFYLGSLHSGISTVQGGQIETLLETLVGVALVSAGASALNEALERTSDTKMIRTANRP